MVWTLWREIVTIKDKIVELLEGEVSVCGSRYTGLAYDQIASRLEANEPSVRRAARQLYVEGKTHYTTFDSPVRIAFGHFGKRVGAR